MTTIDLRSTQKVYKPKTDADKKIEEMEIRLKSITQTLNLILKKLDNYWPEVLKNPDCTQTFMLKEKE